MLFLGKVSFPKHDNTFFYLIKFFEIKINCFIIKLEIFVNTLLKKVRPNYGNLTNVYRK